MFVTREHGIQGSARSASPARTSRATAGALAGGSSLQPTGRPCHAELCSARAPNTAREGACAPQSPFVPPSFGHHDLSANATGFHVPLIHRFGEHLWDHEISPIAGFDRV